MSLGQAAIDVTADTSQFESGLKSGVGRAAKAIGVGVAAVGALGAAAVGAGFKVAAVGDDLDKTSARLGVHTDFLQDARFWADQNGISHSAMEKAVGVLNQRLGDGTAEGNQYVEAMNNLGVATLDAEGQVRSAEEVMTDTITALMGMESASEQAAAAEDLFGARAARELLPALREGSLTLEEATAAMDGFGRMTEEQVKASAEFSDTWDRIKQAGESLLTQALFPIVDFMNNEVFPVIEDKVIPVLQNMFAAFNEGDGVVDGLLKAFGSLTGGGGIGSIFERIRGIIQKAFSGIVNWLATGGVTQILNALLEARTRLVDAVLQLLPAIIDALASFIPQLLATAAETFGAIVEALTETIPQLLGVLLGEVLPALLTTIVEMIPDLLETAVTLFETLLDAVVEILPGLISLLLGTVLPRVLQTLLGMIPQLLQTAIRVFLALVQAVVTILPQLINVLLVEVLPALLSTLLGMIPELLEAAITTFLALVAAVIEVLPQLIGTIVTEVVPGVVSAVITMGPQLLTAGKEVMNQLWAGIKEVGAKVVQWVKDNVVGAIRNLWPFSPAKEGPFAGRGSPLFAGRNIAAMLGEGIAQMTPSVVAAAEDLTRAAARVLNDVDVAVPSVARTGVLGAASGQGGPITIDLGGISVTVQGDLTRERARQIGGDIGEAALERLSRAKVVQ